MEVRELPQPNGTTLRSYFDVDDKSTWGDGPWANEPDKVTWTDTLTKMPCMIRRGPSGAWCGYVAVSSDHPAYETHYNDIDVEVHGGLTFADRCHDNGPEAESICHISEPGASDDVWWLGFDCAHAFDVTPKMDADLRELRKRVPDFPELTQPFDDPRMRSTYRDINYVMGEVRSLAHQLSLYTGVTDE